MGIDDSIREMFDELSERRRGVIEVDGCKIEFKVEDWESVCIEYYAREHGLSLESEDDYWDALFDAIDDAVKMGGWDECIYVPPEDSGVVYGCTVFYRVVQ